MSSRSSKSTQRASGSRRWSLVLRCVLLISSWQGPPPSIHCHGTLVNSPVGMVSWLGRHLQSHHASVAPFANVFFGWHVHFDPPGPAGDDPDRSCEPGQNRLPPTDSAHGLLASLARSAGEPLTFSSLPVDLPSCGLAMVADESWLTWGHFFAAFAPTLPLPMRFCVCRC